MRCDVSITLDGLQTTATIERQLGLVLPNEDWYVDWVRFVAEMKERCKPIADKPFHSLYVIPMFMDGEI